MKRALLIGACMALVVVGCGGTSELDSGETETVSLARSVVASTAAGKPLNAGDAQKLENLMFLCREKPLADTEGSSMRELVGELATELKGSDPEWSKKLQRLATSGCD